MVKGTFRRASGLDNRQKSNKTYLSSKMYGLSRTKANKFESHYVAYNDLLGDAHVPTMKFDLPFRSATCHIINT